MELYIGEVAPVTLTIWYGQEPTQSESAVAVEILDSNGELIDAGSAVGPDATTSYSYSPPSSLFEKEQWFTVKWEYTVGGTMLSKTERVHIVTPYVRPGDFMHSFPGFEGIPYHSMQDIERSVRYVLNAFCGQQFRLDTEVWKTVYIGSGTQLYLPERLVRLRAAQSGYLNVLNYVYPDASGYLLHYASLDGYVNVKADIGIPGSPRLFGRGDPIRILGDWGWEDVPQEVEHAAKLLMARYLEPESEWHRSRVESIGASDHKLTFTKNPYASTGDLQVDQLLEPFKLFQPGAI